MRLLLSLSICAQGQNVLAPRPLGDDVCAQLIALFDEMLPYQLLFRTERAQVRKTTYV
jgi:hypothetical protein